MGNQVTLTLPRELYEHAKRWATLTHRGLPETLTDTLALALHPMYSAPLLEKSITALSNREVITLTRIKMQSKQGHRLNELLRKQREGVLVNNEQRELLALMQVYDRLWVRQSEALAEAVRRGLREPLKS